MLKSTIVGLRTLEKRCLGEQGVGFMLVRLDIIISNSSDFRTTYAVSFWTLCFSRQLLSLTKYPLREPLDPDILKQ